MLKGQARMAWALAELSEEVGVGCPQSALALESAGRLWSVVACWPVRRVYDALLKALQADMEENPTSLFDLSVQWGVVKRTDERARLLFSFGFFRRAYGFICARALGVFLDSGSPPENREEKLRKLRREACELLDKALNEIWFIGMDMRLKSYGVLDRDGAFFETFLFDGSPWETLAALHEELLRCLNVIFEPLMRKVQNDPGQGC